MKSKCCPCSDVCSIQFSGKEIQCEDPRYEGLSVSLRHLYYRVEKVQTDVLEKQKLWIGVPRPWRSTSLPPDHCWANGDFVAFADWPELKDVYEAGGFAGMLMAWNAGEDTQAANLGQWRPDAAKPTGLFTPNLTGQFLRCWGPGADKEAGTWGADTGRGLTGSFAVGSSRGSLGFFGTSGAFYSGSSSSHILDGGTGSLYAPARPMFDASRVWGAEHTGTEFAPQHIWYPFIIYLGKPAVYA